ncbi:MAG TPA: polysaccharide deacetylase family protein [Conexibacter sp.]|jgi:peptidoglycan/xylan/chitin deacetylase (PgdA/CDA1 family)|nr:polysaccharide deacetylase family protein [Conexibacter sp.]
MSPDLYVDPARAWVARERPTTWPGGAGTAVSITFDVDAELSGAPPQELELLEGVPITESDLGRVSEGQYGIRRGLPRILALLDELRVPATFFVPGATALRHPEAIRSIAAAGHEIGHHGHLHLPDHDVEPARLRDEIELGLAAHEQVVGRRPYGYRSPSWSLSPTTLELLREHGFRYDSSMMADDRPNELVHRSSGFSIVELAPHWDLDDWPWFPLGNPAPRDPELAFACWWAALTEAPEEGRHVVYTFHPEVIGRAHRLPLLRRLLTEVRARDGVWLAPLGEVEQLVRAGA